MNKKQIRDFLLYVIVGGIATVVEWVFYYVFYKELAWNYMIATVIAYIISTFANWAAGRLILFKNTEQSLLKEIASIYAVSVIGLLMNMAIMWIAVDFIGINKMISKILATGIVFFWNFIIRKIAIYKE